MNQNRQHSLSRLLAAVFLAAACSQPVLALEVGGIQLGDTSQVAGAQLKLNGAGLRTKAFFKVYALGLYLPEKKRTVAEILAAPGPRRISIALLRDVSSDDFGQAFMTGLNNNSDKAEKSKIINQTMQFGEMFAQLPGLKKGDLLTVDWVPGAGTQCQLNGKRIGETAPDLAFYNAILKIWIGDKPADAALKPKLLGEPG